MNRSISLFLYGTSTGAEGGAGPEEHAKYTESEKTNAAYCALQISVSEPNRPTMMRNIEILEGAQIVIDDFWFVSLQ